MHIYILIGSDECCLSSAQNKFEEFEAIDLKRLPHIVTIAGKYLTRPPRYKVPLQNRHLGLKQAIVGSV